MKVWDSCSPGSAYILFMPHNIKFFTVAETGYYFHVKVSNDMSSEPMPLIQPQNVCILGSGLSLEAEDKKLLLKGHIGPKNNITK